MFTWVNMWEPDRKLALHICAAQCDSVPNGKTRIFITRNLTEACQRLGVTVKRSNLSPVRKPAALMAALFTPVNEFINCSIKSTSYVAAWLVLQIDKVACDHIRVTRARLDVETYSMGIWGVHHIDVLACRCPNVNQASGDSIWLSPSDICLPG